MLSVNCPNCGAEVIFRSPALPVRVCDYCRTEVMRVGDEIRNMGEAAVLPFDVSPIQIRTSGKYGNLGFTIIGRVRWGWTSGSWNEWLMLFDDGRHGWLAEAMGQFMVSVLQPAETLSGRALQNIVQGGAPIIGTDILIGGKSYRITDIKQATCIAAEGELPFVPRTGWTITNIDMRTGAGDFASLQRDGGDAELYVGRYVDLADLKPQWLREIKGWAMPGYAA